MTKPRRGSNNKPSRKRTGAGSTSRGAGRDGGPARGGRADPRGTERPARGGGRSIKGPRPGSRRTGAPIDRAALLRALTAAPGAGASGLAEAMGLPGPAARDISVLLRSLKEEQQVIEQRPGRWMVAGQDGEFPVRIEADGDGLLAAFDGGKKLPIDPAHRLGAQVGDRALATPDGAGKALILRITQRLGRGLVGSLDFSEGQIRFVPDNRREGALPVQQSFKELRKNYEAGDRLIGTVVDDGQGGSLVRIEQRLDESSPEVADFAAVCINHDLPGEFPEAALKEAERADGKLRPDNGREDLRQRFIFTIDPETAKDFDDAISLERLPGGHWRVGVHIADVSHFVRPGTALDDEAQARGTSIYLVNRVIPMLPERLSNGLCSLVPDQDRCSLSVFVDLDGRTRKVLAVRPAETLMRSRHRLTYEEALAIIEEREPAGKWPEELTDLIRQCHRLAQQLRGDRVKAGAINLYSVERRFVLDETGVPVSISVESGDVAHQLIEELMLLANRTVADWLVERGSDAVFRVHAEPDPEKLTFFGTLLEQYGIAQYTLTSREGIQQVLRRIDQEPDAARLVLNSLLLRCFAKAEYQVQNIGHYALAFDRYLHFTSPIRRYPDLIVHRLVKRLLNVSGYASVEHRRGHLDAQAKQCSYLEQRAVAAERQLDAIKAARYLERHLGEAFSGVVLGAGPFGLYVQLVEAGLEGMLPLRELGDDFYRFDQERQAMIGSRNGLVLGIGTEIDVIVAAVDVVRGEVSLARA